MATKKKQLPADVQAIVDAAENEVKKEDMKEKTAQLKKVIREIQEAQRVVRRLEAKKEQLILDLSD